MNKSVTVTVLNSTTGWFVFADVDGLITQALLTGDFEGAVDLCLHDNRMADSIILAIAGGAELLKRTQKKYFSKTHTKLTKVWNPTRDLITVGCGMYFLYICTTLNYHILLYNSSDVHNNANKVNVICDLFLVKFYTHFIHIFFCLLC